MDRFAGHIALQKSHDVPQMHERSGRGAPLLTDDEWIRFKLVIAGAV